MAGIQLFLFILFDVFLLYPFIGQSLLSLRSGLGPLLGEQAGMSPGP